MRYHSDFMQRMAFNQQKYMVGTYIYIKQKNGNIWLRAKVKEYDLIHGLFLIEYQNEGHKSESVCLSRNHATAYNHEFRQCLVDYNNIGCDDYQFNSKKRIKKIMKHQRNFLKNFQNNEVVDKMLQPSLDAVSDDDPGVKKRQKAGNDLIQFMCPDMYPEGSGQQDLNTLLKQRQGGKLMSDLYKPDLQSSKLALQRYQSDYKIKIVNVAPEVKAGKFSVDL